MKSQEWNALCQIDEVRHARSSGGIQMKPGDSVVVYNSRGRTWLSALGKVSNPMARRFVESANFKSCERPYCIVRIKSLKPNANPL